MAAKILIHSGLATLAAVILIFWVGRSIIGLVFVIPAFGLATVWVYTAHSRATRTGVTPPRWLAALERIRQYLANEEDESHKGGTSDYGPRATAPAPR